VPTVTRLPGRGRGRDRRVASCGARPSETGRRRASYTSASVGSARNARTRARRAAEENVGIPGRRPPHSPPPTRIQQPRHPVALPCTLPRQQPPQLSPDRVQRLRLHQPLRDDQRVLPRIVGLDRRQPLRRRQRLEAHRHHQRTGRRHPRSDQPRQLPPGRGRCGSARVVAKATARCPPGRGQVPMPAAWSSARSSRRTTSRSTTRAISPRGSASPSWWAAASPSRHERVGPPNRELQQTAESWCACCARTMRFGGR